MGRGILELLEVGRGILELAEVDHISGLRPKPLQPKPGFAEMGGWESPKFNTRNRKLEL